MVRAIPIRTCAASAAWTCAASAAWTCAASAAWAADPPGGELERKATKKRNMQRQSNISARDASAGSVRALESLITPHLPAAAGHLIRPHRAPKMLLAFRELVVMMPSSLLLQNEDDAGASAVLT